MSLRGVLYVPSFTVNSLSMKRVRKSGHEILVKIDGPVDIRKGGGLMSADTRSKVGMIKLRCRPDQSLISAGCDDGVISDSAEVQAAVGEANQVQHETGRNADDEESTNNQSSDSDETSGTIASILIAAVDVKASGIRAVDSHYVCVELVQAQELLEGGGTR